MTEHESNRREGDDRSGPGPEVFRRVRFLVGGILFLAITVGVFWYQFHRIAPGSEIPRLGQLRWVYLFLVLLFLPAETLLSGLRMWMICRVLQPGVSYATCVRAELANAGLAILTPSQTGGGPGQMYVLNRGGVKLGTALTISLLTFMGTMAALTVMGGVTLLAAGSDRIAPVFVGAAVTLTLIAVAIFLSAAWPDIFRVMISGVSRLYWRARRKRYALTAWRRAGGQPSDPPADVMGPMAARLVDMLYTYHDDLGRFLRKGKRVFALTCLLSILFFCSRFVIAFLCVRFVGIRTSSLGEIVRVQMALVFVTYLGPTPGSAGIAEGASMAIMSGIVPVGYAPYYNLLWRCSTVYVAAATGLCLLLRSIVRDVRDAYRRRLVDRQTALPGME